MGKKLHWRIKEITIEALYNLYRSTDPNLPKELWTRVNDEPLVDTKFKDKGLEPGVRYYYYVTAFYPGGPESKPSEVSSMVAPGKPN